MICKLVILLLLFNTGNALRCYKCTARSQSDCESKQYSVKCDSGATSCLTLQFKENIGTSHKVSFSKKCSTSYKQCLDYCEKSPLSDAVIDCQVLNCCKGDYCNKKYVKKINRKRAATGSHSVQMHNFRTVVLLTFSSLLTVFGTVLNFEVF